MILALRQRHHRMFAVIGVLLPMAFGAGLAARQAVPNVASLPAGLAGAPPQEFAALQWERGDLFPKSSVRVRLLRESQGAGRWAFQLSAPKDFVKPDLLVYWISGNARVAGAIPDQAILLGGFDPAETLPLPADAASKGGALVLYSLADHEVVGVSNRIPF